MSCCCFPFSQPIAFSKGRCFLFTRDTRGFLADGQIRICLSLFVRSFVLFPTYYLSSRARRKSVKQRIALGMCTCVRDVHLRFDDQRENDSIERERIDGLMDYLIFVHFWLTANERETCVESFSERRRGYFEELTDEFAPMRASDLFLCYSFFLLLLLLLLLPLSSYRPVICMYVSFLPHLSFSEHTGNVRKKIK